MTIPVQAAGAEQDGVLGSTLTLTVPPFSVGQLAMVIAGNSSGSNTHQYQPTAGWTLHVQAGDAGSDAHQAVYTKRIDGTEGWVAGVSTEGFNSATELYLVGEFSVWDGVVGDIHVIGSEANTDSSGATTLDIPAISTTLKNCKILCIGGHDGSDGTPSISGSGFTLKDSFQYPTGSSGSAAQVILGEKDMSSSGNSGVCTLGNTASDGLSGVLIALAGVQTGLSSAAKFYSMQQQLITGA